MVSLLKILLLICFLPFSIYKSVGQSFDNFQYYHSDQFMNPAFTGNHSYEWRIYNHYFLNKTIAPKGYQSFYLAGDYNIAKFPNHLSLAIAIKSESLVTSPMHVNQIYVTMAHHWRFLTSKLHIGIQPGFISTALNMDELTFPDQYDRTTGGFNWGSATMENLVFNPTRQLALNSGIQYEKPVKGKMVSFGLAYFYVSPSDDEFYQSILQNRLNLTINTTYNLAPFSLRPFVWMSLSENSTQTTLGSFADIQVHTPLKTLERLIMGAKTSFRSQEYPNTVDFAFGLQWKRLITTLNYKYPFRLDNKLVHEFNSFELAIIYNGFNANVNQFVLPCEFY